jgi:hypothetical protein
LVIPEGDIYYVEVKRMGKNKVVLYNEWLYYNEDETREFFYDWIGGHTSILANVTDEILANNLTEQANDLGFNKWDIKRLKQNDDYRTIIKLIDIDSILDELVDEVTYKNEGPYYELFEAIAEHRTIIASGNGGMLRNQ